jgi:hypothetical protein
MTSRGLANAKLEPFQFGRGWANDRFVMIATTPGGSFPVIGMATAWTPGTNGPVSADAVFAPLSTERGPRAVQGKLQGKIVLTQALRDVPAHWTAESSRYSEAQLEELTKEDGVMTRGPVRRSWPRRTRRRGPSRSRRARAVLQGRRACCDGDDRFARRRRHAPRAGRRGRQPPTQR